MASADLPWGLVMLRRCSILSGLLAALVVALPFALDGVAAPVSRLMSVAPLDAGAPVVPVQYGPGGLINPGRDCQTIRQCRFERGGSFRGCISAYTCRVCRLVEARCNIGGRSQNCREMQCGWGG